MAFWPFSSGPAQSGPAARPGLPAAVNRGRIVVLELAGYLALSDPDGTHVTRMSALGNVGQSVTAAPDGRYLSLGNGQFAVVRNAATLAAYPSKVPLSSSYVAAAPDSFADHDRDLVMLLNYGGSSYSVQNPVTVFSLDTGSSRSLGISDAAAGDPMAAGAFVSVAAPPRASVTATQVSPDSRVELRDAGQPALMLATAGSLNRDLGQGRNDPVQLIPYPDPSGDKIAVVVVSASDSQAGGGIVVLNRAGRVLATVATPFGVPGIPAWAPSGASLAYASTGSTGNALFIWTVGRPGAPRAIPSGDSTYVWCVWSPDGRSILCDAGAETGPQGWAVGTTSGAAMTMVGGAGRPVAWLPGRGGK